MDLDLINAEQNSGPPAIQLYWRMVDDVKGFMERMVLPDGKEILFDHEAGKTDLEPLKEYIGYACDYHVDGKYKWSRTLDDVGPNEDGVNALFFTMEEVLDDVTFDEHSSENE